MGAEVTAEPGFGEGGIPFGSNEGDAEDVGDLFEAEAAEEAEFEDGGFAFVEVAEAVEGVVEGEEFVGAVGGDIDAGFELDEFAACAFFGFVGAGEIDEDATHDFGGEGVEVGAVFEGGVVLFDHAHVGFVDERGGLQGMVRPLVAHVAGGDFVEFRIDERGQLIDCGVAVFGPVPQDLRDIAGHLLEYKRG